VSTSVKIEGLNEIAALVAVVSRIPTQVIDQMATVAFGTMRAGAGRHSPRPGGTGNLFASLFYAGAGTKRQEVGHDGARAPYAEFVIFGSRPHEIRPKNAKVLSWIGGPGFNTRIFARKVWHPGYIGDNYRDTALNDAIAMLPTAVGNALKG
jgi:hypothetical protein